MNRRNLLTGIGALLAAPAIVHAGNIMPIKPWSDLITTPDRLLGFGLMRVDEWWNTDFLLTEQAKRIGMGSGLYWAGEPIAKGDRIRINSDGEIFRAGHGQLAHGRATSSSLTYAEQASHHRRWRDQLARLEAKGADKAVVDYGHMLTR